ncbi:hypothetical protein PG993_002366 [Apiospora rasikravindrae]|uniref:Uncharacterized protein n=1 Tax=Apiospora rasikravindrae TaxID=990691 RepID=A0ABR1TWF4_9PEZI
MADNTNPPSEDDGMHSSVETKYYLKRVIQRAVNSLELGNPSEKLTKMVSKFQTSVPFGVYKDGTMARIKCNTTNGSSKGPEDIPLHDNLGPKTLVTLCHTSGAPKSNDKVIPLLIPRFWPKLAAELADAKGIDGSVLTKLLDKEDMAALLGYTTVSAFEDYPWTPEQDARLVQFQHSNPMDVFPIGILKLGLLNYWWQKGRKEEGASMPPPSRYLGYFPQCIARAVTIGTVFAHDPEEFTDSAYKSDSKFSRSHRLSSKTASIEPRFWRSSTTTHPSVWDTSSHVISRVQRSSS